MILIENLMCIFINNAQGSKSLSHYPLTAISNTYEVLQCTLYPLDGLWTTRILRNGIHLIEETGYFLPQYVERPHLLFFVSLTAAQEERRVAVHL